MMNICSTFGTVLVANDIPRRIVLFVDDCSLPVDRSEGCRLFYCRRFCS